MGQQVGKEGIIGQRIRTKLTEEFHPVELEVTDVSHRHAGHSGASPLGETHFEVRIVSEYFNGLSKVKRHQAVYKVLDSELKERVHALAIEARGVGE